ncbi:hypothetical protein [Microbacterium sp. 3J1]|uniref:hypothetical protein n=1 Tax=Microbacterium sp. 3J1 TaxID=861269 RepID=UPI000A712581|nr:hypothetical protein [Microbacterium sp. 3J1]
MACRFGWCETPADLHASDTSHHSRELGYGMMLTVDLQGEPISMWMPDWDEWWIDKPEDVDTEYAGVAAMLRDLPANYTAFRTALVSDPLFADEVAAMKAKDAREACK